MPRNRVRPQTKIEPAPVDRKSARDTSKNGLRKPPRGESRKEHLDRLLDEALAETFPASDPPSVS
ncbi:MAG TPA: hypothetical protein VK485_12120 [Sphingomicrobium sp.]|nr:hypothetical protein [Sphingomicrobium sp.]